jgi:hypothetical protein
MEKITITHHGGQDLSLFVGCAVELMPDVWMKQLEKEIEILLVTPPNLPPTRNIRGSHNTVKRKWSIRLIDLEPKQVKIFVHLPHKLYDELSYLFRRDIVTAILLNIAQQRQVSSIIKEAMSEWSHVRYHNNGISLTELIASFLVDHEKAESIYPQAICFISKLREQLAVPT